MYARPHTVLAAGRTVDHIGQAGLLPPASLARRGRAEDRDVGERLQSGDLAGGEESRSPARSLPRVTGPPRNAIWLSPRAGELLAT